MTGKIARLVIDKGFGFIEGSENDWFFHRSVVRGAAFEDLQEGQAVTFEQEPSSRGPRARFVAVIPSSPLQAA